MIEPGNKNRRSGAMDESWNDAWLPLLPAGVMVRAGAIHPEEPPVHPDEERALQAATASSRIREHRAGRRLAREALLLCGGPNLPVLNGADGAPVWPEGWLGSITHGRGVAAAVVARSGTTPALGIDLEEVGRVRERLRRMVFSDAEQFTLRNFWAGQEEGFTALVFSAKEAFFKAQWPLFRSQPAWKEVTVSARPDSAEFWVASPAASTLGGHVWAGRHAFHQGHVLCLVGAVPCK